MTGRPEIRGYDFIIGLPHPIQCAEITSSSDPSRPISRCHLIITPRGRRSYRNSNHVYPIMFDHVSRFPINPIRARSISRASKAEALSGRTSLMVLALIFACSLLVLTLVYTNFPKLTDEEREHIKLPWNIEEAKQLGIVLNRYKDDNYFQVMSGVFITYIFLQTFAIPGSLFLSILSGFLFPFVAALVLVCSCSAIGASLCFLLSQLVGRKLVLTYFPERAKKWAVVVDRHNDNLFSYIVFLRITPFLPNWFINLTAPVIGVPLKPFALGTFFGVGPPSCLAIQAGRTLNTMSSTNYTISWPSIILLGVFALLSLVPVFFKKELKNKFD